LAAPLNEIVKKEVGFKWGEKQEQAFAALVKNSPKHQYLHYQIFLNLLKLNVMLPMLELALF